MSNIHCRLAVGTICALLMSVTAAQPAKNKYPKNLFAVSVLHFDAVRSPHGLDYYLQSREAQAIIGSMAKGAGISPVYLALASVIPTATVVGEETNYVLPLEPGYAYCGTRIRVTSIVPHDGDRASTINAAVNSKELQMSTWTPVRHFGEGRAWAEGDIQLYGIQPRYLDEFVANGVCKKVTSQIGILSCRGGGCDAGITHGNPQDAGNQTPSLETGW